MTTQNLLNKLRSYHEGKKQKQHARDQRTKANQQHAFLLNDLEDLNSLIDGELL